jgi:ABC-type glutathione transport system ATPase component
MASNADAVLQGGIEEVDAKEKSQLSQETEEVEWHISDDHQQNFSFSDVRPADISVRGLEVEVDVATSFGDTFKARFAKPRVDDVEGGAVGGVRRKKILKGVSTDFPAGSLTAIIGGSGSGKVCFHLRTQFQVDDMLTSCFIIDNLSQCSLRSHARLKPHNHRKHTL